MKEREIFYCYSLQLMGWLLANGHKILKQETHPNGNKIWLFLKSLELNKSLEDWKEFKRR